MQNIVELEAELAEAFQRMYGAFPKSAMLLHKSKRIVALNLAARDLGREPGNICAKLGPPEMHAGCLAHRAVSEQKAMYKAVTTPQGRSLILYWLPVIGYADYYVHFSVGNVDY